MATFGSDNNCPVGDREIGGSGIDHRTNDDEDSSVTCTKKSQSIPVTYEEVWNALEFNPIYPSGKQKTSGATYDSFYSTAVFYFDWNGSFSFFVRLLTVPSAIVAYRCNEGEALDHTASGQRFCFRARCPLPYRWKKFHF